VWTNTPCLSRNVVRSDERSLDLVGSPVHLSNAEFALRRAPPALGEDGEAILAELGFGAAEAESDELEKIRQSCVYVEVQDGCAVVPSEVIDAERSRVLTVLAAELMAEVLGHFPWEFERMLDNVIAFERSIGMPEKKIARR
jgi:hypothetical protein